MILEGLKDIESVLKLYPQDFFKQLKTRAGDGGLYIYLVGGIDGDFSAVAYEFSLNNSENVVVNINEGNLKATFCHEVWHAIENVIVEKDGTALDDWEQYLSLIHIQMCIRDSPIGVPALEGNDLLNEIEKENAKFIRNFEKKRCV